MFSDLISSDDLQFIIYINYIVACMDMMQVMSNEDAVKCVRGIKDPRTAAKHLNVEAISRKTTDDVSTVVVRFR